jgi:DNA-directed RNA polymerase subunit omega
MARITIEKELKKISNKYLLTKAAIERALKLVSGIKPLIENKDNNKEVIVALREIAEGKVKIVKRPKEEEESRIILKGQRGK